MNKPKKHYLKLAQKIKYRTKLLNRVLFLKKIHKVEGDFVLLGEKYFMSDVLFNCLNCKHNQPDIAPTDCPKYNSISIRLIKIPRSQTHPGNLRWICYGHKFKNEKK